MEKSEPEYKYFHPGFGNAPEKNQDSMPNEALIWENFKKGNKSALTFIYRNYTNPLFNYGCQIAPCRELVKDAIQDLFMEIINNKERLGRTDSIKYYLFKSLRNKLIKHLARQQKENLQFKHHADGFQVSLSPEVTLINRQIDQEKCQVIAQKLNELPPLQREALILVYYEGMTYEQISGVLGIKVKSARELIYRATRSMGKLLLPLRGRVV